MPTTEGGESKLKRVAVVVTHGVGEAEPGQCTVSLVHALAGAGRRGGEAAEVLLLPDGTRFQPRFSDDGGAESHCRSVRPSRYYCDMPPLKIMHV